MRIVAVKGFSNTGKTTTVTELVKELRRRGYTVGTIKDIHYEGYRADTPGTDTFRHMESGARRVTALGLRETAVIAGRRMRIEDVLKYYKEDFVSSAAFRRRLRTHVPRCNNGKDRGGCGQAHVRRGCGRIGSYFRSNGGVQRTACNKR